MQAIFIGLTIIALGLQASYLKWKSKEEGFESFSEPYKNRFAKLPVTAILGIIVVGSVMIIFGLKDFKEQKELKSSKLNSSPTKAQRDCSNSTYKEGYSSGKLSRSLGGTSSCQKYVSDYNYNLGRDVLTADDCFCEGFDDGYQGNVKKY